jgi:hypothetical protein
MHGEAIGFGVSPMIAASYAAVAVLLLGCAKFGNVAAAAPAPSHDPMGDPHGATAPAE